MIDETRGAAWLETLEIKHCTQGGLPDPSTPELELYRSQVGDWNARKAEGISLSQSVHPLLKFRSFMMRGRLTEAQVVLAELREDSTGADAAELLLEESRLAATNADWLDCIEKASLALEHNPSAVSQLTLRQVRANARFEIGAFVDCADDLEVVDSLLLVLPKSSAGFYAKALEVKLRARMRGLGEAGEALARLWDLGLDADRLLTLCRIEIDLARLEQRPTLEWSLAALWVARHLGDLQYEALAALDVAWSLAPEMRQSVSGDVKRGAGTFRRVAALREELVSARARTTTALAIARFTAFSGEGLKQIPDVTHLYLESSRRLIALGEWRVCDVDRGKIADAIGLLCARSEMPKDHFFRGLWGRQKYVPHLHDNLIWNLVSRARKKLGIEIEVSKQAIALRSRVLRVI